MLQTLVTAVIRPPPTNRQSPPASLETRFRHRVEQHCCQHVRRLPKCAASALTETHLLFQRLARLSR